MDSLFLSILESSGENDGDPFTRSTCLWWIDFVVNCSMEGELVSIIENKVNEFNGRMVRGPDHLLWLGVQFNTEKDKLLFMLKYVK